MMITAKGVVLDSTTGTEREVQLSTLLPEEEGDPIERIITRAIIRELIAVAKKQGCEPLRVELTNAAISQEYHPSNFPELL